MVRITRHDLHPLVLFARDFRNAPARERYCHGASARSFGLPTRKPHWQDHYQSLPAVARPRLFRLLEDAGSAWTNSAGKGRSTSRGWASQCQPTGHSPGERVFRLANSEIAHNKRDYCTWQASLHPTYFRAKSKHLRSQHREYITDNPIIGVFESRSQSTKEWPLSRQRPYPQC